jgi:hypothetical protein
MVESETDKQLSAFELRQRCIRRGRLNPVFGCECFDALSIESAREFSKSGRYLVDCHGRRPCAGTAFRLRFSEFAAAAALEP